MPSHSEGLVPTVYSATVETLTPLHVGSGEAVLQSNLDFVEDSGALRVVDITQRALEALPPETLETGADGFDLSLILDRLKKSQDLTPEAKAEAIEAITRYRLKHPGGQVRRIIPHVKTVDHRPYVPGSSLKGAIRTALAWKAIAEGRVQVDPRQLGVNPRYAAADFMLRVFGWDPHSDLLRVLHVADSSPSDRIDLERVEVHTLQGTTLRGKGDQFSFFVEVIPVHTSLRTTVTIDEWLLRAPETAPLELGNRVHYLRQMVGICQEFAGALIAAEIRFYGAAGQSALRDFYQHLEHTRQQMDTTKEFVLQISWGAGWNAKTIGLALEESIKEELRTRYRLGRSGAPVFPKSRRLVGPRGLPASPLGWIKVRLEPVVR